MSHFAWIDFDDRERKRMQELIRLLRQPGTLDELGTGGIRDVFAEHFFPGTSTLHTRVKYFLFVPWLLQSRKVYHPDPRQYSKRLENAERELVKALKKHNPGETGIIGSRSEAVRILPSAAYWSAIRKWGICRFDGAVEAFLSAEAGRLDAEERLKQDGEDTRPSWWDTALPGPPGDFPTRPLLALTAEEAAYLKVTIRSAFPDSLFAALLDEEPGDCFFICDHPVVATLPGDLQHAVRHAGCFSDMVQGAALLYNCLVAEKAVEDSRSGMEDLQEEYRIAFAGWIEGVREVAPWDTGAFASLLDRLDPGRHRQVLDFIRSWALLVRDKDIPAGSFPETAVVRKLLYDREYAVKGTQSRLHSRQARNIWEGGSGLARYDYRWSTARAFILEIQEAARA